MPARPHQRYPPDPGRPKDLYVRGDQLLPRLAALAILQAGGHLPHGRKQGRAQVTPPAQAAGQIEQPRIPGVSLIYAPATKPLRADPEDAVPLSVG